MLELYHSITKISAPALRWALASRLKSGKEDPARLNERMGIITHPRPRGHIIWFHAASVGEAQSTLVLVNTLVERFPSLHILVTTGTVTSANLMGQRLPDRAIHQYYPLDHPEWVSSFLDHWNPDFIFWMESELWPNMLRAIRERNIHCILVNARMSRRSYRRWHHVQRTAAKLLSAFDLCIAQTEDDAKLFRKLGILDARVRNNLKYAANPLPNDPDNLAFLQKHTQGRLLWLYASTHAGEEKIACDIHKNLKQKIPNLLTVIVPRHPERRNDILTLCKENGITARLRTHTMEPPHENDDIYIADTLGELGLFYRLCPVTCIGRTFSDDGGGGHNPIEAAQLGCAVLHGPNIQNLAQIFDEMDTDGAAELAATPEMLESKIATLLMDPQALLTLQVRGKAFAQEKADTLATIIDDIEPLLADCGILEEGQKCA